MTDQPNPTPSGMPGVPASLVDRVKNILTTPKTEWDRIDAEPATIGGIYTGYVMILAAIGPIAGLIGQQVMMGLYKPALTFSIATAVITYLLSLASVYVMALIIDALAPTFNGTKDSLKAFKVAAYYPTAAWVAAIFNILPMIGWLGILIGGLYGLYILYLGLPKLMRVPESSAVGYIVLIIVAWFILYALVAFVAGMLVLSFFGAAMITAPVVRY
jgi:hypothetical protein